MIKRVLLSVLWLLLSALTAPLVWGLVGGLSAVLEAHSFPEALSMFLMSLFYAPLYAIIVVAMFTPAYAPFFLLWPFAAPWLSWIEGRRKGLFLAALLLALPAGFVVGGSRAGEGAMFDQGEYVEWFAMATVTAAVAIVAPRLLLPSLSPGVFGKGNPA